MDISSAHKKFKRTDPDSNRTIHKPFAPAVQPTSSTGRDVHVAPHVSDGHSSSDIVYRAKGSRAPHRPTKQSSTGRDVHVAPQDTSLSRRPQLPGVSSAFSRAGVQVQPRLRESASATFSRGRLGKTAVSRARPSSSRRRPTGRPTNSRQAPMALARLRLLDRHGLLLPALSATALRSLGGCCTRAVRRNAAAEWG